MILQFFKAGSRLAHAGVHSSTDVGSLNHGTIPIAGIAEA